MIDFQTCQAEARAIAERNDCAVKAVAIATQTPYDEVHMLYRDRGRKRGRRTPMKLTHEVLAELGADALPTDRKAATVATVPRAYPSGSYLIRTSGHILACVDGKVEDWTAGRRHRVLEVLRIRMPEPRQLPETAPIDMVVRGNAMPRSQISLF